jgi:hypothetical protein
VLRRLSHDISPAILWARAIQYFEMKKKAASTGLSLQRLVWRLHPLSIDVVDLIVTKGSLSPPQL